MAARRPRFPGAWVAMRPGGGGVSVPIGWASWSALKRARWADASMRGVPVEKAAPRPKRKFNPKGKPMAKAKPKAASGPGMRPMVRAGTVTTTAATRRKPAKRAPRPRPPHRGPARAPARQKRHGGRARWGGNRRFRGRRATVKVRRGRARRVRRLGSIAKGSSRYMWVDAFGKPIKGRKRWSEHHRGGLTLGGKRRKAKKGGGRKTKGRTAAQRAATKKMIAANRRRAGGAPKKKTGRKTKGRTAAQRAATKKLVALNRARKGKGKKASRKAARYSGTATFALRRVNGKRRRNPRGGSIMSRRNPRRRRRRNPGMDLMGTAKRTISAAIPAVAGGAAMAIIDAKLLADRPIVFRVAAKVVAAAAAGVLLRSRPVTANLVMGAMLGSLGGELALKMAGGLMTPSKAATVQALGTLIREDPGAMSALIDATGAYSGQVPQMSGFETMADVNLG